LRCRAWRRGGRRFRLSTRAKICRAIWNTKPQATQALILGAAALLFLALCLVGFDTRLTLLVAAALLVHAGLFVRFAAGFFVGLALGLAFLLALLFLAPALFFLGLALLFLALTILGLTGLRLGLKLVDQGHHLANVLILDVRTRARLNGNTVLLGDRKDVLAFHSDGFG
jgi:hypothetical protein